MKSFLCGTTSEATTSHEFSMTLLRVFTGLTMAFAHGLGKLPPPEQLIQGISAMGFPLPEVFAWLTTFAEFGGGILLALGLFTRPAALFLTVTMFVAGFIVHKADPLQVKELAFLYLSISFMFLLRGSGRWSVDHFIFRRK